jgi:hypothetical protein
VLLSFVTWRYENIMNSKGKTKGTIASLLAVILISAYFIYKQQSPARYTPRGADWACEECGLLFTAPAIQGVRKCPECGGEAVRTYIYYNSGTDELIEVYREKYVKPADLPPGDEADTMERLIKEPGGKWHRPDIKAEAERGGLPVDVDNPENLIYAPPGSKYRK